MPYSVANSGGGAMAGGVKSRIGYGGNGGYTYNYSGGAGGAGWLSNG
jgi:hypothetical protein